jgi:hypothetical protein
MASADKAATLDTLRTAVRIRYAPNAMYLVLLALITGYLAIDPGVLLAPNHMITDIRLSSSV